MKQIDELIIAANGQPTDSLAEQLNALEPSAGVPSSAFHHTLIDFAEYFLQPSLFMVLSLGFVVGLGLFVYSLTKIVKITL